MSDEKKIVIQDPSIVFCGLLTLLFIGLKLGGCITLSWWWVLSPIWISFGVVISLFALFVLIGVFVALIRGR